MRKTTLAMMASALAIAPITAVAAQEVVADPAGTTIPADDADEDRDDDSGKWGLLGLLGLAGLLGLKRRDRDDDHREHVRTTAGTTRTGTRTDTDTRL